LDGNNFRVSDDGEPSGSAGKPILGQIDSNQLTNVLIVVVRYFGGTLLGVPGLINAYKSAATFAIQVTPTVKQSITDTYQLHFDYTQMNDVMRIVKQFDCLIVKQEAQLFCVMDVAVPRIRLQEVLTGFRNLRDVRVEKN
jgi:putative IMPACT (imprinted ancient) family translation regulator